MSDAQGAMGRPIRECATATADLDGPASTSTADLVVIGAGVAGLVAALRAAEAGLRVAILTKGRRWRPDLAEQDTSTFYAQGGVAVVLPDNPADSVARHLDDTVAAGGGLTDVDASRGILADGWTAVSALIDRGARFDRDARGVLLRTREGGHSVRRIIHAGGDATGAAIQRTLTAALARAERRYDIDCIDEATVSRILTTPTVDSPDASVGTTDTRRRATGVVYRRGTRRHTILAPTVLLATGGAGHLYAATTNPAGVTGDGIALALRAGADVADLEFIQFHPTMLYTGAGRGRRTLITEALRGEGAHLVDVDGRAVTEGVHPLGDLAPRDVVANAVRAAMDRTESPYVWLDVRAVTDIATRFPTVAAGLRVAGLDIADGRIPVLPGAHYLCGGVVTGIDAGTTVPGLLAAGEVARTGLHGANRLASNSLLEGLVMGARAAEAAIRRRGVPVDPVAEAAIDEPCPILDRTVLQDAMSTHVALRREADGLAAVRILIADAPRHPTESATDDADAALTLTAAAVVAAATARTESRGCHVRVDYPDTDPGATTRRFRLADGALTEIPPTGLVAVR